MKQIKYFGTILLGVIFSLTSLSSKANDGDKKAIGTELKYVGLQNNLPSFQLTVNNEDKQSLVVSLQNGQNQELFTQKVTNANTSIIFQLDVWDVSDNQFKVIVKNAKTKKSEVFSITMGTKTVLEASVTKK